jgi:hypothetical protein
VRELDVRYGEGRFVNVTVFVLHGFRTKLLAVNHLFVLIVLCLSLNGSTEMLLEITKIVLSANSAALDKAFIFEGRYCTFTTKNNGPRNDSLEKFGFHFFSL